MTPHILRSFFNESFRPLFLRGKSERTIKLYATTLRKFDLFLGRAATLDDLTDDTVGKYLSWFRALPRAAASANKERCNILALWRFAARKKAVDHWPDVQAEPLPKRIPRAWTSDELTRLIKSCQREPGNISGIPAAHWWTALHLVAWDTGERISALLGLEWKHVDLSGGWLHVPAEVRKGKKADRLFRLGSDTILALKNIQLPKRPFVFPWILNRGYIWDKYEPILERAGLPTDRMSKFHRMRKSVASHYEALGGNATELLGHAKRATTMAYIDPRIATERQASDVLFRISSPVDRRAPPGHKPPNKAG